MADHSEAIPTTNNPLYLVAFNRGVYRGYI